MVKIEKETPIPPRKGRPIKWPWKDLAVGDSFLMRGVKINHAGTRTAAKRYGLKLTARTVEGGVRVWRKE